MNTPLRGMARAAAAVVLVLGLAGCATDQSKSDACAIVNPAVASASANLSSALNTVSSNPTAAAFQLDAVATNFANSAGRVTNPGIKKSSDRAKHSLSALVGDLKGYLNHATSRTDDQLGAEADQVTADFSAVQAACK